MKSIAVWCNKKNKDQEVSADIHFNFWKTEKRKKLIPYDRKYHYLLDIGVLVYNIKNINSINLFFPFEIEKRDFNDLGKVICNNMDLINGIFNEDYKTVAYHWSKKTKNDNEKIDSFNSLIKIKTYKSSLKTILIYLSILTVLTIGLSLLSNLIQKQIDSSSYDIKTIQIKR